MKRIIYFLIVFLFLCNNIEAQKNIIKERKNIQIPLLEVNSNSFKQVLDSTLFKDEYQKDRKRTFHLDIKKKSRNVQITITESDIHYLIGKTIVGYFEWKNSFFIVSGDNFDNFYTKTEKSREFEYVLQYVLKDNKHLHPIIINWEPPTRIYKYSDGQFNFEKIIYRN